MKRFVETQVLRRVGVEAKLEAVLALAVIGAMSVLTSIFFIVAAMYLIGPRDFQWGLVP